ncbi:MAG: hypothetical protein ACOC1K_07555 [Nanoarchaeota archaeon]
MRSGKQIAALIEDKINSLGIPKTKIGEVLGSAVDSTKQWKYKKTDSFFNKLKNEKVDLIELKRIADFLNLSLNYVLGVEPKNNINQSNQSGDNIGRDQVNPLISPNVIPRNDINEKFANDIMQRILKEEDPEIIRALKEVLR